MQTHASLTPFSMLFHTKEREKSRERYEQVLIKQYAEERKKREEQIKAKEEEARKLKEKL